MSDHPADEALRTPGAPFDPVMFFEMAQHIGHGRALGIDFRGAGEDWIELALPWREELVGVPDTGILASGAIVSLLDTCGGAAVWQKLGIFRMVVTIDLRLDYFRPAPKGETVIARCRCDRLTRKVAFCSGIAHTGDETRPVARMSGTFMMDP